MAPHKEVSAALVFILIASMVLCSCSVRLAGIPANPLPGDFNFTNGARWVYSYSDYEPLPSNPTQTITAQFQLIQTVVESVIQTV